MLRHLLIVSLLTTMVIPNAIGEQPENERITPNEQVVNFVGILKAPTIKSARLAKLAKGESAELIETLPAWYKVRFGDGIEGYVLRSRVAVMGQTPAESDMPEQTAGPVESQQEAKPQAAQPVAEAVEPILRSGGLSAGSPADDASAAPADDASAAPVSGVTASLKQAIETTIQNHPDVLSQSRERLAVEERVEQARAGYFPTVDINGGYGWQHNNTPTTRARGVGSVDYTRRELGVFGRQMLFDGFATRSEVERQRATTNSRAYSVYRISELTALRATNAYLNTLRERELVALAVSNLEAHKRIYDQIKLRESRGVGRKSDLDQILGRVALAESNLRAEQGNLRDAETAYLSVVGEMPPNLTTPEITPGFFPVNVEEAVEQGLVDNPTLKSAMADIEAAKAQHEAAKSPLMPRVDLEVGTNYDVDIDGVSGRNEDAFAMVRMRYNVFAGGKDIARRRETSQLIGQAIEIKNSAHRQVEESIRLSWSAYETVRDQVDDFRQHVVSSKDARDAYEKQFNIGQRTLLDVLDQENEVFTSQISYVNSQYDLLFAKYRVLTGTGKLIANFGVELPEEAKTLTETANAGQ